MAKNIDLSVDIFLNDHLKSQLEIERLCHLTTPSQRQKYNNSIREINEINANSLSKIAKLKKVNFEKLSRKRSSIIEKMIRKI